MGSLLDFEDRKIWQKIFSLLWQISRPYACAKDYRRWPPKPCRKNVKGYGVLHRYSDGRKDDLMKLP
jgi:hypothetical protein